MKRYKTRRKPPIIPQGRFYITRSILRDAWKRTKKELKARKEVQPTFAEFREWYGIGRGMVPLK